jgi:hypothetical protein
MVWIEELPINTGGGWRRHIYVRHADAADLRIDETRVNAGIQRPVLI